MTRGLMLAKSLPFGKHDAGEHVPAGKSIASGACRIDRFHHPIIRVQKVKGRSSSWGKAPYPHYYRYI